VIMMNKSIDELILDYVLGQLKGEELEIFEENLKNNSQLKHEVEKTQSAIKIFEKETSFKIPNPTQAMDDGFYKMLNNSQTSNAKSWFAELINIEFLKPALYGAAMMLVGISIGHYYTGGQIDITNTENNLVTSEYSTKMQELAVVSMLQLPSVSKRLQAVSLVENSNNDVDNVIITALFNTLNNDSNLNVRLAVLDTLVQFSNTANVRLRLVNSITFQDSPMVQLAIADLMLDLQETKAIKPLKKLLDNKDLIEPVRKKIIYAVNELI